MKKTCCSLGADLFPQEGRSESWQKDPLNEDRAILAFKTGNKTILKSTRDILHFCLKNVSRTC